MLNRTEDIQFIETIDETKKVGLHNGTKFLTLVLPSLDEALKESIANRRAMGLSSCADDSILARRRLPYMNAKISDPSNAGKIAMRGAVSVGVGVGVGVTVIATAVGCCVKWCRKNREEDKHNIESANSSKVDTKEPLLTQVNPAQDYQG